MQRLMLLGTDVAAIHQVVQRKRQNGPMLKEGLRNPLPGRLHLQEMQVYAAGPVT